MKIVAPFVIVCLGLLALAAWQLKSLTGEATPESAASTVAPVNVDLDAEPQESDAGDVVTADGGAEVSDEEPVSSAVPAAAAPADERPAASTSESRVRWADDDERRSARERFAELRATLADDPHNEAALEAALRLAGELEWPNEVCDLLARLSRLRPDDVALRFELAVELMRLERWVEAIPQLRFVVERQPDDERAWYNLAIAHQALGHLREARATWNRVVELLPENPDAYAHRGEVLLDLRAWAEAATDFETSLSVEPGSLDVTMNLSLALLRLGRAADARDKLLPLLEQHPLHVPLLNRLAEVTWSLHQADPGANKAFAGETLEYCTRSLAVAENQPEIRTLRERAARAAD